MATSRIKKQAVPPKKASLVPVLQLSPTSATFPATAFAITPLRLVIPESYTELEPRPPLSAINDDPVFNTRDAAEILGVSYEAMKKWRERDRGPDYIQYGFEGPIRYSWNVLLNFRERHTVHVGTKKE